MKLIIKEEESKESRFDSLAWKLAFTPWMISFLLLIMGALISVFFHCGADREAVNGGCVFLGWPLNPYFDGLMMSFFAAGFVTVFLYFCISALVKGYENFTVDKK
ncbi:hypothetical protein [Stenoxybacter acetivorans]|uniref:hypothetical protein n=1 Tax=Stenoxybacter acetivorans TaxID=422441 RepID=UPI00055D2677|nr:hypothetical protein [Stenoxybacter acetivorans]